MATGTEYAVVLANYKQALRDESVDTSWLMPSMRYDTLRNAALVDKMIATLNPAPQPKNKTLSVAALQEKTLIASIRRYASLITESRLLDALHSADLYILNNQVYMPLTLSESALAVKLDAVDGNITSIGLALEVIIWHKNCVNVKDSKDKAILALTRSLATHGSDHMDYNRILKNAQEIVKAHRATVKDFGYEDFGLNLW